MSLNIPVHYNLSDSTLSRLFSFACLGLGSSKKKTSTDDDEYESDGASYSYLFKKIF